MAIGDFNSKRLLNKTLTTTATDSVITGAATKKITITSISLLNTGSTARVVSVYQYGTAVSNEVPRIPLAASGGSEVITGLDYVLLEGESFYFKQDVGADVNIVVIGTEEVIA